MSAPDTNRRDARSYTICFDFAEAAGPVFAWRSPAGIGWTVSLRNAIRFETEADAERFLSNAYGSSQEFGAVVEVEQ